MTFSSLQRYRTAENLRLDWENQGGLQRRQNQLFSWDDDFWKTSRRSPQSVASSASTFEEVESLCFSKSSTDSFNSSLRHWDHRSGWAGSSGRGAWPGSGGGTVAQAPGRFGATGGSSSSRRQRISRQSSTTSTSTSRSSAGAAAAGGDDDFGEFPRRSSQDGHGRGGDSQSIKGKLIESMEFLGSNGNLDLADKLYMEKIFNRVLGQAKGQREQPAPIKSALKKERNYEQPEILSGNELLLERLQRLRRNQLIQREAGSAPASATSSPVLTVKGKLEKKRRKDLIIPDEEEPPSYKRPQWTPASERYTQRRHFSVDRFGGSGHPRKQSSDSISKSSMISSMSSLSMENGSLRASPSGSISPVSPNNTAEQHPNLATFLPMNRSVQRLASVESVATGPPSESAYNIFSQPFTPSHAERVLMGLGFGATEGFLPERFLKDWYTKISRAHSESGSGDGTCANEDNTNKVNATNQEVPLVKSAGQKESINNARLQTGPANEQASSRMQHPVLSRHDSQVSSISSVLDEAATYVPKGGDSSARNDRIGDYIAAHSSSLHQNQPGGTVNSRAQKMRQFASARQKSLPLHLETLTEEDELRIRKSGLDPFDKEARLQMFISDTMSSSGRSSKSEQSRGSNQSESDSLSSCSEFFDVRASMETPQWQETSTYRKQQEQIPRQLQQVGRRPTRKKNNSQDGKRTSKSPNHQSSSQKRKDKEQDSEGDQRDDEIEGHKDHEVEHNIRKQDESHGNINNSRPSSSLNSTSKEHFETRRNEEEIRDDTINSPNTTGQADAFSFRSTHPTIREEVVQFEDKSKSYSPQMPPLRQSISFQSGDSLEVADIMQNPQFGFNRVQRMDGTSQNPNRQRHESTSTGQNRDNHSSSHSSTSGEMGQSFVKHPSQQVIEPAMVSIVLEDVDQNTEGAKQGQELAVLPQEGNHLNIPLSRCSSLSLSPIPQSPVTVIEVGQLDNQQDSLDTEGTGSSEQTDEEVCSSENSGKSRRGGKSKHSSKHSHNQKPESSPSYVSSGKRRNSDHSVNRLCVNEDSMSSRRFGLDVPTVARLRRISEQRLQELNGQFAKQDNEEGSSPPPDLSKRRGSSRRASFSDEKPIIINDFLAKKESSRSPSPQRRTSCIAHVSGSSMEGSGRRKSASRDRRPSISRSVSPSKSPSPSRLSSLSPSQCKERDTSVKRHKQRHHHHDSHRCHHHSSNSEDRDSKDRHRHHSHHDSHGTSYQSSHRADLEQTARADQKLMGQDSLKTSDSSESSHCCCHHGCHRSKFIDQRVEEPHCDLRPHGETSLRHSQKAILRDFSDETRKSKNCRNQETGVGNVSARSQHEISSGENQQENHSQSNMFQHVIPTPNESEFPKLQFQLYPVPQSVESSPGSARSAFRHTGKLGINGRLSMPGGGDYQSETDVDEFPSSVKITLNQRPISSFNKNIETGTNPFRRNSSSSSLVSLKGNGFNPNLLFSSSPKRALGDLSDGDVMSKDVVHTISRAVQVSDNQLRSPGHLCTSHSLPYPQDYYFLAKDQATQCNREQPFDMNHHQRCAEHSTSHIHHQTLPHDHTHVYNKFTQTGVTCYEVSCQTEKAKEHNVISKGFFDVESGLRNQFASVENVHSTNVGHELDLFNFEEDFELEDKNTHSDSSLHHSGCSNKDKRSLQFSVIDETIKLIEAELLHINTKRKPQAQKNQQSVQDYQNGRGKSLKEKAFKPSSESSGQQETFLPATKKVSEKYAPSTWTDATRLSPYHSAHKNSVRQQSGDSQNTICSTSELNVGPGLNSHPSSSSRTNDCDPGIVEEYLGKSPYFHESQLNDIYINNKYSSHNPHPRSPLSNLQNSSSFISSTQHGDLDASESIRTIGRNTNNLSPGIKSQVNQQSKGTISNKSDNAFVNKESSQISPELTYPTVDSKDLIVKMYALQQGLSSYLKPCEGMYGEKDAKEIFRAESLDQDIEALDAAPEKENTKPVSSRFPYDFSIENANTSSGFSGLFYSSNKAKRRFSTPAVCDGAHWARTHSKLSRLKYQNNSHQNSFNSLDIEVDFMNAGEPLGISQEQKEEDAKDHTDLEHIETSTDFVVRQSPKQKVLNMSSETKANEKYEPERFKDESLGEKDTLKTFHPPATGKPKSSPRIVVPCEKTESGSELTPGQVGLGVRVSPGLSSSPQFLSPRDSVSSPGRGSPGNGSTPEIVISPLKSAHNAFLSVPHSPQQMLLKARFPSVSSSASGGLSPTRLDASAENARGQVNATDGASFNSISLPNTLGAGEDVKQERKTSTHYNMVRGSISSSILDSSTLGSLTDLSNVSSLDQQSMGDLSKASMHPHLSTDSATDQEDLTALHSALDELSNRDIGTVGAENTGFTQNALRLRRALSLLGNRSVKQKGDGNRSEGFSNVDEPEAVDEGADNDSNASLAGSDQCTDVDDMEVMVHQSRVLRGNSSSTYSDPDLDFIDCLTDDSLASSLSDEENAVTRGTFLTVSGTSRSYTDDLLQVSDYGGNSPILSPKDRVKTKSSPVTLSSAIEGSSSPRVKTVDKGMTPTSLSRFALHKSFSESWVGADLYNRARLRGDAETPDIEFEGDDDDSEVFDHRDMNHPRRSSKDNWDVVHALIVNKHDYHLGETVHEQYSYPLIADSNNEVAIRDLKGDRGRETSERASTHDEDDSSGDECDKEITQINNSKPSVRRLVKTHSDPCDKGLYCQSSDTLHATADANDTEGDIKAKDLNTTSQGKEVNHAKAVDRGILPDHEINEKRIIKIADTASASSRREDSKSESGPDMVQPPHDNAMLEVFQNADLSVLKNAAGLRDSIAHNQINVLITSSVGEESTPSLDLASESVYAMKNNTVSPFIPRIVGLEFSSDEETRDQTLVLSDSEMSLAIPQDDLDSGLTEDLELVLSKSGDEFDELTNSLLVKDAINPGESGLPHTPLSQITEEDTQSECSASEASCDHRLKVWQVRNRFVYTEVGSGDADVSRPTRSNNDASKEITASAMPSTELLKGFHTDTHLKTILTPVLQSSESYRKRLFGTDSSIVESDVNDQAMISDTKSKLITESATGEKMNEDCPTNSRLQNKMVDLNKYVEDDNSELYDDAFYPDAPMEVLNGSSPEKANAACVVTQKQTVSNVVYTLSTPGISNPSCQPQTRVLSPRSGIFKFAQGLLEDIMDKAHAEHKDKVDSSRQNPIDPGQYRPPANRWTLDTRTVERSEDKGASVTNKVSNTSVTTRTIFNAPPKVCRAADEITPEENHVSTKTIEVGDYRKVKSGFQPSQYDSDSSNLNSSTSAPIVPRVAESDQVGDDNHEGDKVGIGHPSNGEKKDEFRKQNSIRNEEVKDSEKNVSTIVYEVSSKNLASHEVKSKTQTSGSSVDEICDCLSNDEVHDNEPPEITNEKDSFTAEAMSADIDHSEVKVPILDTDVEKTKLQAEMSQEGLDFSMADLKSRVKAMLLIDHGEAPGSTDSSSKDDHIAGMELPRPRDLVSTMGSESFNASYPALKRVKVTTMFSQASEDGGVAFLSSSVPDSGSEADKSPGSDVEDGNSRPGRLEDRSNTDAPSPIRSIRTQMPQYSGLQFRTKQSGAREIGGGRKQLKTFRSRDSLLKLHQQTNVSSSAGSDSDSDFSSALRNEKQVRGKIKDSETDLNGETNNAKTASPLPSSHKTKQSSIEKDSEEAKKKSQFLKVEPERRRSKRKLGSPEPYRDYPSPEDIVSFDPISPGMSIDLVSRRMSSSSGSSFGTSTSNPPTPKVVVQQPSEDASTLAQNQGKIFNFPSRISAQRIFSRGKPGTAGANDNHLHTETSTSAEDSASGQESNPLSPPSSGRGPWGLRAHRPQRPQFLSPNTAMRPPRPVTFLPIPTEATYTREDDPSHPELAYLDIVSKMNDMNNSRDHLDITSRDKTNTGGIRNRSPPAIVKTDFTTIAQNQNQSDTSLCSSGAGQPNRFRNLGSPEPRIVREAHETDTDDTIYHLDLFPSGPADSDHGNTQRPGLSVVISSDHFEPDHQVSVHPKCEEGLEMSWPAKSLSVTSKDSGFDSLSQGSPSEMAQSHKFTATPVRSIEIVQEESET